MSKRRAAVLTTGLCVALVATVWMAAATVPLNAAAPGGALQTTGAGQPAAGIRHTIVLDFTLPSGHQPKTRGREGDLMRIWLRDAGKLGFVTRMRDDAQLVAAVTVFDLDSVPRRELGTVDIAVGGDPVTFQASVPFQIAVPRIIDMETSSRVAQLRAEASERRRMRLSVAASELQRALEGMRTRARITAAMEELRQALAALSDQLGSDETTVGELLHQLSELEELLQRLPQTFALPAFNFPVSASGR